MTKYKVWICIKTAPSCCSGFVFNMSVQSNILLITINQKFSNFVVVGEGRSDGIKQGHASGFRLGGLVRRRTLRSRWTHSGRGHQYADNILKGFSYYSELVLYRNLHIPDPENFSPAQKQFTVCFVQSTVFGYTGFLIYRTLNLSPNPSPV